MLVIGFAAALTGTAIMTTLLSPRLHYVAQIVISFMFSGFVQPALLHSSSIYNGWMKENKVDYVDVSFKDTGMVLVTSVAGSTAGIVGCIFLRKRMLRLSDIHSVSIGPTSPGLTMCGYFLILIGFVALALPSPVAEEMQSSIDFDIILIVSTFVCVAVGTLTVFTLHFIFYRSSSTYWTVLKLFQGGLASFIAVSSAYDFYDIPMCVTVALIGGICFFFASEYYFTSPSVEDNCNIISVHFVCGILSCLLPPFFSRKGNLGFMANPNFYMNMVHLAWQMLCCLATIAIVAIIFTFVFLILLLFGLLRNKIEIAAHNRGKRFLNKEIVKLSTENVNVDPISPSNELENIEMETVSERDDDDQKQNIFICVQNTDQTPVDSPNNNVEVKNIFQAHKLIKKKSVTTRNRIRTHFQKCKNVVVRNPLYSSNNNL